MFVQSYLPDHPVIAAILGNCIVETSRESAICQDKTSLRPIWQLSFPATVQCSMQDDKSVLVGLTNGMVFKIDVRSGALEGRWNLYTTVLCLAGEKRFWVAGTRDGSIYIPEVFGPKPILQDGQRKWLASMSIGNHGTNLRLGFMSGDAELWQIKGNTSYLKLRRNFFFPVLFFDHFMGQEIAASGRSFWRLKDMSSYGLSPHALIIKAKVTRKGLVYSSPAKEGRFLITISNWLSGRWQKKFFEAGEPSFLVDINDTRVWFFKKGGALRSAPIN